MGREICYQTLLIYQLSVDLEEPVVTPGHVRLDIKTVRDQSLMFQFLRPSLCFFFYSIELCLLASTYKYWQGVRVPCITTQFLNY